MVGLLPSFIQRLLTFNRRLVIHGTPSARRGGILQKEVAAEAGLGISHYSKIENGQREASVELVDKLASFYGISIDQIVHMDKSIPKEVTLEDKTAAEQMRLIAELDEKDKSIVLGMIETMLTKKKFKDFFNSNIAAL